MAAIASRQSGDQQPSRRRFWWIISISLSLIFVALLMIFGGGILVRNTSFAQVAGSWRLDVNAMDSQMDPLSGPDASTQHIAEDQQLRLQISVIKKAFEHRRFTFDRNAYVITDVDAGSAESRIACTYVGESEVFLRVIGESPGEADDLAVIIDLGSKQIFLRTSDFPLPLMRD